MRAAATLPLAFLAAAMFATTPVGSQSAGPLEPPALELHRATDQIVIDGRLDDKAWRDAEVATGFIQQVPRPGEPATFPTEARVLMSDDALYVGVRMLDPAPDSVVARLARRGMANESDWVHVAIDSHLDRRTAFQFGVNAAGVKRDVRISDDVREDPSWDAVWDVAVARHEDGWSAEFRIPLSELRFDAGTGERSWGFNVTRIVARTGEISSWAPIERNSGSNVSSFGLLTGVSIERAPRRIEVFPYLTTRVTRAPGDAANPFYRPTELSVGTGADLRVGLSSWLTATATVNPDFGQVEADPAVVNLSAFEVMFPERRPFFIEGDEYFRTPQSNLFYSRRIGRAPQLAPPSDARYAERLDRTTILGAAKLTGRSPGGWSIGALSAVTAEESVRYTTGEEEGSVIVEPLTSYFATRVGRDFRDGRSALNVTATAVNRSLDDSPSMRVLRREAYSGGVDARHRFGDNHFEVSGNLYWSQIAGDSLAMTLAQRAPGRYFQRPDADHLAYEPDRTSLAGHSASLRVAKVAGGPWRGGVRAAATSPGFEINDMGSQFSVDRIHQFAWLGYHQFTQGSLFRRWSVRANQSGIWTYGGEQFDLNGTLEADAEFHNRWTLQLWGMRHLGGVDPNALRGGPAYYNPGSWMGSLTVTTDPRASVSGRAHVFADVLDRDEGSVVRANASVVLRPSDRMEMRLGPSFTRRINGSQFVTSRHVAALGEQRYVLGDIAQTTAAVDARLNFAITPNLSLELHARPFIAAGRFDAFHAVAVESASDPARDPRLSTYDPDRVTTIVTDDGGRILELDETGDGESDIRITHPDFSRKDIRSTAVLRWEFQPGSSLFVVWSHNRSAMDRSGEFDLALDLDELRRAPGRNTVAIKASYRIGW